MLLAKIKQKKKLSGRVEKHRDAQGWRSSSAVVGNTTRASNQPMQGILDLVESHCIITALSGCPPS